MPLAKTIKEGNTTTEVHDLMGGVGKLSVDEVLAGTGGKADNLPKSSQMVAK